MYRHNFITFREIYFKYRTVFKIIKMHEKKKQSIQNRNKLLSIRKQREVSDTKISTATTEMIGLGRGRERFGEEFFSL